ncbi:uncharacterized protein LOC142234763 isoform X1 [Haematobia irritans]|uniref:uncharacterized protein LOC142234763 isoform X1 n=1 Tax=Haematobia irritans TaxID=7368 RepID=UPI003F4FA3A9
MSGFPIDLEFDRKLIDLIKANPMLYERDLRSSPYNDMKKKFELWSHIGQSLNRDTKDCLLRWKSLRAKYRREMAKLGKESGWELLDNMKFIEKHIKYQGRTQRNLKSPEHQSVPFNYSMEAEQLIEEIHDEDDDPLQEAMDEQISTFVPSAYTNKEKVFSSPSTTLNTTGGSGTQYSGTMKRIEALLEGLGGENQHKAEKRIVAYLCKCQLKTLNNEDVDEVDI